MGPHDYSDYQCFDQGFGELATVAFQSLYINSALALAPALILICKSHSVAIPQRILANSQIWRFLRLKAATISKIHFDNNHPYQFNAHGFLAGNVAFWTVPHQFIRSHWGASEC